MAQPTPQQLTEIDSRLGALLQYIPLSPRPRPKKSHQELQTNLMPQTEP